MQSEISWATPDEIALIRRRAASAGRQTMNLSLPTGRVLRALSDNMIVGWVGVDVDHIPEFPEAFSFYVDPRYRGVGAGQLLRAGVAMFLKTRELTKFYIRVALTLDHDAEAAWSACGARRLEPHEIAEHFDSMCNGCNLFGTACTSRVYLVLDVETLYQRCVRRLAATSLRELDTLVVHGQPMVTSQAGWCTP